MKRSAASEAQSDSSRSRLARVAVELATQGRWREAAGLNRRIIEQAVDDVRGYNRLGRALEALGRTAEAREAYSAALAIDPRNPIAARSLNRLAVQAVPSAAAQVADSAPGQRRHVDYGRLETRVEEPPELQEEYLAPYEEYETEEPQPAIAERIELAGELLEEARLEELEGAVGPDLLEEEWQQEERDRALAAEEERDER